MTWLHRIVEVLEDRSGFVAPVARVVTVTLVPLRDRLPPLSHIILTTDIIQAPTQAPLKSHGLHLSLRYAF